MKHNFKKATSWLLTLAMIVTMLPAGTLTAFAAEDTGLCEHHPAHTAECGYVAAAAEVPCGHEHTAECYTLGVLPDADSGDVYDLGADTNALDCQHIHDAECGYIAAVEAHECHYECGICAAQELIDALPTANAYLAMDDDGQVAAQDALMAAYEAYSALPAEDQAQVNTDALYALQEAVMNGGEALTEEDEVVWSTSASDVNYSYGTFAQAVEAANAADSTVGYIGLSRSFELTETAVFNPASSLTLDLQSGTLSAAATASPVISVTGGSVTITDSDGGGSITATGGNVFTVSGGTLTLSGGAYSAAAGSAVISYSGGSIVITGTMNDAVTISFASTVSDVSSVVELPTDWALHGADGQEVSGSVTQGTTLTACAKASEVASGNEGNVTWKITGNDAVGYTLTISGTGAMADYSSSSSQPWYSYRENITKVVVTEGITHVGKYAFAGSGESKLETVSLPSGLESIGERAFAACPYLQEAAIPAGVTSIGEGVFYECSSLESITIPDSVTAIPDDCFSGCSKLETIHIGSGVASIGSYVFEGCTSLTGFTVSESNATYKAVDGVLFTKDDKTLQAYPAAKAGEYTIPSGVETIAENAFAYSKVTSVTIPASVTTIGDYCFSECESLTQFVVAEGNSSYSAVDGVLCEEYEGQTTLIAWPGGKTGAVTVPEGIETIAAYAFLACAVTSVTLPDSLTTIGGYAFYDCTSLSEIVIPAGVTSIGGNAFRGCTALTAVTFHSAPNLGSYVFGRCTGLTTLNLYAVPEFDLTQSGTFYGCTLANITVNLMCNDEANVSTFTGAGFKEANKSLHADSATDDDELCDGGCGTSLHVHDWVDGQCQNQCGKSHAHEESDWANKDGICITCGGKCTHGGETPTYANGVCTTCGAAHDPHSYENGFCTCGGYEEPKLVNGVYQIANAGQLYWFANYVNTTYPGVDAVLIADITVNPGTFDTDGSYTPKESENVRDWTPIGTEICKYSGTFDGQSHTISGLYFSNESTDYVGLFGYVRDGTVKNVGVVDSYFCGKQNVGGVVGLCEAFNSNSASVENCYNTGIVNGTSDNVGGVVGYLYAGSEGRRATATNCYNTGTVSGNYGVGGVVGSSTATDSGSSGVENCYNTGAVRGTGETNSTHIGGVVGENVGYYSGSASVKNCYNTGTVSGSWYVGGVAGRNYADNSGTATIENCYYLTGCATDRSSVTQFGIGASDGSTTEDVVSGKVTAAKDKDTFKSGAVAYLLNGDDAGTDAGVWKQTLDTDDFPNFTGKTVYQSGTGYTNHEHNWSYEGSGNQIQATCTAEGCTLTDKTVTITLTATAGTYDGTTAYTVDVSDNPPGGFTVPEDAITYTKDGTALADGEEPIDAGNYTATLTLGEGTNAKTATVTYTIAPKDITNATAGTFGDLTYTGEAQTPSATVTLDGKTVTGSWSAVTNVGEESTFTASGNYTGTLKGNPGMKPKAISINGATIEDVLYNENGDYTLNVTGVTFDGTTLTIGTDYTASAVLTGTNQIADNVAATVTVTLNNGNYSLSETTYLGSVNIITHTHVWSYSASENVITAKCNGNVGICPLDGGTVTITLVAPTGTLVFDGNAKTVGVEQSPKGVFSDLPAVKYTVMYEGDDGYTDAPDTISAGSYKATLTIGTATAEVTFTIDRATISTVTLNVTDPVQGAAPQSTVTPATGYAAYIDWDTEEATFGFNTVYTATVTLQTNSNHQFADNIAVDGWTVKEGSTPYKLILTKTFPATRKAELQSVTAPTFEKFSDYHETAANAITELPTQVTYGTESGNVNAEIQWTCENYNPATKAVNTFTWTVKDGELADYANTNTIATTGTITVTNVSAIPVTNTGVDATITYDGNTYDVAQMFTKDTNAGEATYSIVAGGTGEGTLDGSTLTITKAGTIEIKMTTAANGAYDAGEATATLTVKKGTGSGTVTMADWTYGETAKAPVPTSTTNGTANVTYLYTDDNGYNSVTVPTDAGTYTVTATFAATDLYEAAKAEDTFTISPIKITASISGSVTKPYDGGTSVPNDHQLSITLSGVLDADKNDVSATATYAYDGTDVGTTTIKATDITLSGDKAKNYELTATTVSADSGTITKVESTCTPPDDIDNLVFNGSEQALITAGTAIGGEMQYKLGSDGTWGTEIPKGKNAGNYKVFYRVVGDSNHEDNSGGSVVVIIKQAAAPTVTIDKQSFIRTIATMGNTVDIAARLPDDRGETSCADLDLSGVEGIVSEDLTFLTPSGSLTFGTMTSETVKSGKITLVVIMENYANTTVEVEVELTDKTTPALTLTPSTTSMSGAGTVTLTVGGLPTGGSVTVTCDNTTYNPTGSDTTWSVTLPNSTATYVFTASFAGDDTHNGATATCTVNVTYKSSGSSYTPSTPSTPTTSVTIPISGDENTINVDASVKGEKATVDEVDLDHLDKVIGDDVSTGTVTIDFSGLDSKEPITTVEIPSDVVKQIAEAVNNPANDAESMEVILSDGTSIEFDAVALGEKAAQAGGMDITISIESHEDVELTSAQKNAVGDRVAYDINVTSGGKHISDMGGKITVHAPYELKPGEKAHGIVVWYVDDNGNRERCETSYDSVKKRVNWKTDHLSLYMIDYDEALAETCPKDDTCPVAAFTDADPDAWYHDGIHYALENGMMAGYGNGLFGTNDSITRGQIVTILWRLEGSPVVNYLMNFEDVPAEKYYTEAIRWANSQGIVGGYGNGKFGPDDPITRQQLATMVYRYEQYKGGGFTGAWAFRLDFKDIAEMSDYAYEPMCWCVMNGIVGGYGNGYLGPNDGATRAQAAAMLMRYCTLNNEEN